MYTEHRAHDDANDFSIHHILRIHIMSDYISNTLCTLSHLIFITDLSGVLFSFSCEES